MKKMQAILLSVLAAGSLLLSGCTGSAASSTPTPTPYCDPSPEFPISAYDLWLQDGNEGTVKDFLDSLVGEKGADGFVGYSGMPVAGTAGADGKSAYQLWLDAGNAGTIDEFVASLTGSAGVDGLDGLGAYELWASLGNTGTEQDFLDSLEGADGICSVGSEGPAGPQGVQGEQGIQGVPGATGAQGPQGPAGSTLSPVEVSYVLGGGTTGVGATPPTFDGNPMFYGSYVSSGDSVFFNVRVVMTNITSFGHGQYYVTLPFPAKYAFSTSNGRVTDSGLTRNYVLYGYASAGSSTLLLTTQGSGQQVPFDYNTPVTLSTSDVFLISGTYIRQ